MSVTERIGTKPSWVATILVGLLVAASVACAGSAAPPDSLDTDRFDFPGVVVQYDTEPTFSTAESFQPFGRVPPFTMLEDGTLVYVDEGRGYDERVMEVKLSENDADALLQQVLDLGFERLGNHADQCEDSGDGTRACLADGSYTVLRVHLPSGEPRQVRIYANFGRDPQALVAISSLLSGYSHPDARPYVPAKATLFIRPIAVEELEARLLWLNDRRNAEDVTVLEWELDPAWLEAGDGTGRQWARVVDGDALASLLATVPSNVGAFFFQRQGEAYHTTLVPWLPSVDYTTDVAAYRHGDPRAPEPELVTPAPLAVSDPDLADIIDVAIIDLATTLGVDSSGNVGIRSASSITWSDTALGCPQPGYTYAQVVTPGFLVVLVYRDQDLEYRYHSDLGGPPFLCETLVREAMRDPEYRGQEAELASTPTLEPTPTATPTPTSMANPTSILLPQWPLIRLRHDGQVYRGVKGNSCWPVDPPRPLDKLCGDEGASPWEVVDTATGKSCPSGASWCGSAVPVPMGDSIIVEIDADDQPNGLQVAIYNNASRAHSDPPAQVIELETGFTAPFAVDVPAGTYYLRISGQWDDGNISYKFKMVVTK